MIDPKQGQVNIVNLLISSPEFLKNAQLQFADEKKAYVDSIMPFLYKRDKQLKIKAQRFKKHKNPEFPCMYP